MVKDIGTGEQLFFSVVPVRLSTRGEKRYFIEIPKDQVPNVKGLVGKDLAMTLQVLDYTKLLGRQRSRQ